MNSGQAYLPSGYSAQIIEGYNPSGHVGASQHHVKGRGAIDIQIMDSQGRKIDNEGSDPQGVYHQFARGVYSTMQKRYPELQGQLAWGGAFAALRGPDLMHFDIGGERGRYSENWLSRMEHIDMAGDSAKRLRDLAASSAATDANMQKLARQQQDASTGGSGVPQELDHQTTVTTHVNMKTTKEKPGIGDKDNDSKKPRHSLRYAKPATS